MLIHIHRRLVALRLADDTRRYARRGGVRRNRLQYHRTGANLRATPDFNIAEDLRPGANHHAFANFRMTVAAGFTGPAEGDRLQNRDVIFNHRRFADHNAGGMVEHDPAADFRRRVDIHLERDGDLILQENRQRASPLSPQPVADTIGLQGMETLQIEQRRGVFIHRRVARAHRLNIAGGGGDHFRIGGVGLFHHFANGDRRHNRGSQLVGQHIAQRAAEIFMLE